MPQAPLRAFCLTRRLGRFGLASLVALSASCAGTSGDAGGTGGTTAASGGAPSGSGGSLPVGSGGSLTAGSGGTDVASGGGAPAGSGGSLASGGASENSGGAAAGGSSGGSGGGPAEDATYIPDPSWSCGRPEGILAPELGALVFTATLDVAEVHDVGQTQYGERRVLSLAGGPVQGEELTGEFLPGGLDFELTLSSGAVELEHVDLIEASGGTLIYMRTCGMAPAGSDEVRFVPDFEVANASPLAWLNTGDFVGVRRLDGTQSTLTLEVYDVADAEPGQDDVVFADPSEVPDQPWECNEQNGSEGPSVFTEIVLISGSLSVGASKYGTRNAIPITGGTVSGGFVGTVVPAGADFQLTSGSTVLDARYLLESNDGEFLVVRNCGPFGALIPWFEARAEGPYGFLNEGSYLSSDPGGAQGGVSITFYERQ